MKKILTASLISAFLVGCGSDDKSNGLDVDLSQFKSTKQPPLIIDKGPVDNNDEVFLNTSVTGSVDNSNVSSYQFINNTDSTLPVFASLVSSADNLDLAVTDEFELEDVSYGDDSNELLAFQAKSGVQSVIYVESIRDDALGEKPFTLTLEEATRQGLGLSDDEYAVHFNESAIDDCDDTESNYESEESGIWIFNFNNGYFSYKNRLFKFDFASVSGNSFTANYFTSGVDEAGPNEYSVVYSYNLNPDTGGVSGSSVSDSFFTKVIEGVQTKITCKNTRTYDGKIIL
jgi:hypothetical protein